MLVASMSESSDKPRVRQETIDALGEGFVEDVERFVVPIFTDENGAPVSVGTGFLLDTEFGHALVTAAHVLDGFYDGRTYYFYSAPALKREIAGEALFSKLPASGNRLEDLVDVAIVLLVGEPESLPPYATVGKMSLPLSRVAAQEAPRQGKRYAFLGFPASKADVNRVKKDVSSSSYAYLARSAQLDEYKQIGVEETFHIVLPLHKRCVFTLKGDRFNFPALQGMSGSPLWELRAAAEGGRRVVGYMIRDLHKRHHVIFAADMYFVLRILTDHLQAKGLLE